MYTDASVAAPATRVGLAALLLDAHSQQGVFECTMAVDLAKICSLHAELVELRAALERCPQDGLVEARIDNLSAEVRFTLSG